MMLLQYSCAVLLHFFASAEFVALLSAAAGGPVGQSECVRGTSLYGVCSQINRGWRRESKRREEEESQKGESLFAPGRKKYIGHGAIAHLVQGGQKKAKTHVRLYVSDKSQISTQNFQVTLFLYELWKCQGGFLLLLRKTHNKSFYKSAPLLLLEKLPSTPPPFLPPLFCPQKWFFALSLSLFLSLSLSLSTLPTGTQLHSPN